MLSPYNNKNLSKLYFCYFIPTVTTILWLFFLLNKALKLKTEARKHFYGDFSQVVWKLIIFLLSVPLKKRKWKKDLCPKQHTCCNSNQCLWQVSKQLHQCTSDAEILSTKMKANYDSKIIFHLSNFFYGHLCSLNFKYASRFKTDSTWEDLRDTSKFLGQIRVSWTLVFSGKVIQMDLSLTIMDRSLAVFSKRH